MQFNMNFILLCRYYNVGFNLRFSIVYAFILQKISNQKANKHWLIASNSKLHDAQDECHEHKLFAKKSHEDSGQLRISFMLFSPIHFFQPISSCSVTQLLGLVVRKGFGEVFFSKVSSPAQFENFEREPAKVRLQSKASSFLVITIA